MNLLSRILPPQNVVLDLAVTSKKRAFEQAGLLFENHHGIARTSVFHSLIARERLGSTALGHHIAVPHGRIKGLKEPCAAFIRLASPVRFDASDGRLANLLFFLLVPETATQLHLDLLAEIAKLVSSPALRQSLATETDVSVIHTLLTTDSPV
ncbi:PTS sugar transporter subunit IIA [Paralcaligenes sp. KSB-10]|uniref:PTS sugar transporter subunit IIA n=1 Tax=Paralcaligenes sp. KSB-10 TaxID=2901142 RepID=UPI001E435D83|nr:PTS sugar transporter subunit IIA [Paralcaligenes sp. KSB-10]UHL62866.1 PTS sugar transporter subunit IIA [Paralcaligenes sp. KSB-10]